MCVQETLKWAAAGALGLSLLACGGGGAASGDGGTKGGDTLDTAVAQHGTNLLQVGGKLFSFPSPVQTALLFRQLGIGYQKELPLPVEKAETLTGRAASALALGMYGADLAYVTIQRDGNRSLSTLATMEKLSTGLDLSNAFDKALLDRFKRNVSSEDSLLMLTGTAFRAADEYLKVNGRDETSALVLAGGWIESLYLTVNATSSKGDQVIAQRVGEQKRTLDDLVQLVEGVNKEGSCDAVLAELKKLQAAYAGVTSSYVFEKPVTDAKTKTTHINSTSTITITPDQIRAIGEQVIRMRASILA